MIINAIMEVYNRKTENVKPKLRTKSISNNEKIDIKPVKTRRRRTKKELLSPEEYEEWIKERKRKHCEYKKKYKRNNPVVKIKETARRHKKRREAIEKGEKFNPVGIQKGSYKNIVVPDLPPFPEMK